MLNPHRDLVLNTCTGDATKEGGDEKERTSYSYVVSSVRLAFVSYIHSPEEELPARMVSPIWS